MCAYKPRGEEDEICKTTYIGFIDTYIHLDIYTFQLSGAGSMWFYIFHGEIP